MAGFGCCAQVGTFDKNRGGPSFSSKKNDITCYVIAMTTLELRILGGEQTWWNWTDDEINEAAKTCGNVGAEWMLGLQLNRHPWKLTITPTRHVECVETNPNAANPTAGSGECPPECEAQPWPDAPVDYTPMSLEPKKVEGDMVYTITHKQCTIFQSCSDPKKCGKSKACICSPKPIIFFGNPLQLSSDMNPFSNMGGFPQAKLLEKVFETFWLAVISSSTQNGGYGQWWNDRHSLPGLRSVAGAEISEYLEEECRSPSEQITSACCEKEVSTTPPGEEDKPDTVPPNYSGKWKCLVPTLEECIDAYGPNPPSFECRTIIGWCLPCKDTWTPPTTFKPWIAGTCTHKTREECYGSHPLLKCSCDNYPKFREHVLKMKRLGLCRPRIET